MHLSAVGGLLVGLGAVLGLIPRVLWPVRPEPGITFGTLTTREERLRFAVETTGLAAAAAGSILLVIADLARWWLVVAIVAVAALMVWTVSAHKLRQLWLLRVRTAADDQNASPPVASGQQQQEYAVARSRWSWCFSHAFAPSQPWPPPAVQSTRPEPSPSATSPLSSVRPFQAEQLERRHISDLHAEDARLADLAIPPYIRSDVAAMREQGFSVRLAGDAVIVVAPDGRTAQVSRSAVERNSATTVAARQLFLRHCEDIGVKLRTGARGQLHASGGIEWRLADLEEGEAG
jgi:hypothetical protein